MTFPVVETSATTADTSGNSVTVSMPAGIVSGNLLMCFVGHNTSAVIDESGGSSWARIDNGANGGAVQGAVFAKIAAGGDTLTLTDNGDNQDTACVTARISGHDVSDVATDIILGTATTGADASPNPPNCNPGTAADYLWMEYFAADDDQPSGTYWSTNYTGVDQIISATGLGTCMCSVAKRDLNASSENPGTMTMTGSDEWRAQTFAIPPAPPLAAVPGVMVSSA